MMTLALLRSYKRVYLATPYTLFPGGRDAACVAAAEIAGELMVEGVKVFSPIAHGHTINANCPALDPLDHEAWLEQDEAWMDVCDAIVIVELPSWENSFGVAMEADYFRQAKKPVHRLNPNTMELR